MTAFFPPVAPQKGGQLSSGSRRLFRYPTTSNVLLLLSPILSSPATRTKQLRSLYEIRLKNA